MVLRAAMQEKVVPIGFIARINSGVELRNALKQPGNGNK
jgi:hypothetical protein